MYRGAGGRQFVLGVYGFAQVGFAGCRLDIVVDKLHLRVDADEVADSSAYGLVKVEQERITLLEEGANVVLVVFKEGRRPVGRGDGIPVQVGATRRGRRCECRGWGI